MSVHQVLSQVIAMKGGQSSYKLAKTSWASSKNLDTADQQWHTSQLETDVAECRGTWILWGPQLFTCHDYGYSLRLIFIIL